MKKNILLLPLLALGLPAAAQHTEISARAGLGLMKFSGPDAVYNSQVNYTHFNGYDGGYTNSPYGSRIGAGLAGGLRVQHVGRRQGLLAFDLGYDWLHARTGINYLNYYDGASNTRREATGTTSLQSQNLMAGLGLGRRFALAHLKLDVLLGPEVVFAFDFHEKGSGTYDGGTAWASDRAGRPSSRFDGRLRADATAWFQRLGINASYSHGLLNYQSGLVGGSREVYARVARLGLAYQLR